MKRSTWILSILTAVLFAAVAVGCKKQGSSQRPQTLEEGVEQLRAALINANAEVQSNLYSGVSYSIRYGSYEQALMAMDRILNDPSLTEPQKKVANGVLDLLKQRIQNQQSPTNAAQ